MTSGPSTVEATTLARSLLFLAFQGLELRGKSGALGFKSFNNAGFFELIPQALSIALLSSGTGSKTPSFGLIE